MLTLKSNVPTTVRISYDIDSEDSKVKGDITEAKFFLAKTPGQADDLYFIKAWQSGLDYIEGDSQFEVTVSQTDLENLISPENIYSGILAIKYTGDTEFREPELLIGTEPLLVEVLRHYSTP